MTGLHKQIGHCISAKSQRIKLFFRFFEKYNLKCELGILYNFGRSEFCSYFGVLFAKIALRIHQIT